MDDVYKAAVSGQAALLFNHDMIILLIDLSITFSIQFSFLLLHCYKLQEVKLQLVMFYKMHV